MHMLPALVLAGVLSLMAGQSIAQPPDKPVVKSAIESKALRALGTGQLNELQTVAKDIRALKPAEQTKLPLRIRPDGIEFRFRGEFPADPARLKILEYILSDHSKAYESLFVIDAAELARLKKVGEALAAVKKAGKRAVLEYKLVWVEKGQARVEDLQDILSLLTDARRKALLEQLGFKESGLGGSMNVKVDASLLPTARTAGELLLAVHIQ
jgi:hypothetical protein